MSRAAKLGALIAVALLVAVRQAQTADAVIEAIEKLTELVVRKDSTAVDKQARKIAEESEFTIEPGVRAHLEGADTREWSGVAGVGIL